MRQAQTLIWSFLFSVPGCALSCSLQLTSLPFACPAHAASLSLYSPPPCLFFPVLLGGERGRAWVLPYCRSSPHLFCSPPWKFSAMLLTIWLPWWWWWCLNAESCPTLCSLMDCSLAGSPVHGISQARILKWVIIYFSRGSSQTRDLAQVSWTGRWILYQLEYPNHYGCRKEDHCLFQSFFILFLYLPKSNRASLVAQLVKTPPTMWRPGFDPWVGRSPWEANGYPLQYSGLENSMNCIVHGFAKSWTCLSDFHFFHFQIK